MMKTSQRVKLPELLAPAGDEAALRAAVCAGADAVYLGLRSFGARASATNFDAEGLVRAIQYAHLHHVRVHVTVNTLVKECELQEVYRLLETVALARADAVIVQDMGVALLAKCYFPTLSLHASTQMDIHNAAGARFLKDQGFERVVLARECSLAEIERVAQTGIETEIFVHGALCASVSGQCLLSSMAGGRSGNRGRCAQPCRQTVELAGHMGALLSMKDICLRSHLPELCTAGASALKIEGRMKRPEYVAIVTESYRRALDAIAEGSFEPGDEREQERLRQIFHRGGFTAGHAMGEEDADLCATEHVGHGGIYIGRVTRKKNGLATIEIQRELHDGDGLQLRGKNETHLRYSGKEKAAGEEAILRIREDSAAYVGDEVYRLTDALQMAQAEAIAREKPIGVSMHAVLEEGKPASLTVSDGESSVTVLGDLAQPAKTRAITAEEVKRQLAKLGETPFALPSPESLKVSMADGLFVPVSMLNNLRRDALDKLLKARVAAFFGTEKEEQLRSPFKAWIAEEALNGTTHGQINDDEARPDMLVIRFQEASLAPRFLEIGADRLIYAPQEIEEGALHEDIEALPPGTWLELPPQTTESTLEMLEKVIERHAQKLGGVVLGSIGQLGAALPLPSALGSGVPMVNSMAMKALHGEELHFFTLWPELSQAELCEMNPKKHNPLLTVYGRERVMLLHHCPERVAKGAVKNRKECKLCGSRDMACGSLGAELVDRKGYRFPLQRTRMPEGCIVTVLGALPTDLRRHEAARKALGADMLLSFTVEPVHEQMRIAAEFAQIRQGIAVQSARDTPLTQGHFLRGIQ